MADDPVVNMPASEDAPPATEQFKPVDLDALFEAQVAQAQKEEQEQQNPPEGADAGPPETVPGETTAEDQTEQAEPPPPPIEAPRSWSQEDKDLFANLPRETQERLAERERSRERDFLQRQQQANEHRKALEAERNRTAYLRQQYEQSLPQVVQTLQAQMAGEFADLKTDADVERMQAEDPLRFQRWQLAREKMRGYQGQLANAQQRRRQEIAATWQQFSKAQDEAFAKAFPDYADPEKGQDMRDKGRKRLLDLGWTEQEIRSSWEGQPNSGFTLRDHRFQRLIVDAVRAQEAAAKAKAAQPQPPSQPLKPGTAQPTRVVSDLQAAAESGDMEKYFALRQKGRVR
jgi:hypothetical protein